MSASTKRGNLVPVRRNDESVQQQPQQQNAPAATGSLAATAWNPWREMAEMNRWFDDFMNRSFGAFGLPTPRSVFSPSWAGNQLGLSSSGASATYTPGIDLYETPEEVILFAYVPGAVKDAFDIALGNGALTIRGEYQPLIAGENLRGYGAGLARSQGTFETTCRLPVEVDGNNTRASYNNGVLEIHLPKAESAKVKRIPVDFAS